MPTSSACVVQTAPGTFRACAGGSLKSERSWQLMDHWPGEPTHQRLRCAHAHLAAPPPRALEAHRLNLKVAKEFGTTRVAAFCEAVAMQLGDAAAWNARPEMQAVHVLADCRSMRRAGSRVGVGWVGGWGVVMQPTSWWEMRQQGTRVSRQVSQFLNAAAVCQQRNSILHGQQAVHKQPRSPAQAAPPRCAPTHPPR